MRKSKSKKTIYKAETRIKNGVKQKRCTACLKWKDEKKDNFYKGRGKGFKAECIKCFSLRTQLTRWEKEGKKYKLCKKCNKHQLKRFFDGEFCNVCMSPVAKKGNRTCLGCKRELPETQEYFGLYSQRTGKLHRVCKKCSKIEYNSEDHTDEDNQIKKEVKQFFTTNSKQRMIDEDYSFLMRKIGSQNIKEVM